MKFAKTLIASVALVASSQAFAALTSPSSDNLNTGGSNLILGVYDFTTQTTFLLDTNVLFNDIETLSSSTWDFSSELANLSSDFEWQVFAADNVDNQSQANIPGAVLDTLGFRVAITTSEPNMTFPNPSVGTSAIENLAGAMNQGLNPGNTIGGWGSEYGYSVGIPGEGSIETYGVQEFALMEEIWVNKVVGRNAANVSDHIEMTHLGQMTFDNNHQLAFTALSTPLETPIPAAAWLLISGLAGLGGIARRRRA